MLVVHTHTYTHTHTRTEREREREKGGEVYTCSDSPFECANTPEIKGREGGRGRGEGGNQLLYVCTSTSKKDIHYCILLCDGEKRFLTKISLIHGKRADLWVMD